MHEKTHQFLELFRSQENRRAVIREIKAICGLKAYWFSFYLLGIVSALSAAFDTDRIASLAERMIFIMSVSTISALGCAVIAGIYYVATGRSALKHMDVIPKVGLIWLLLATVPVRSALLILTGQPFDFVEMTNAVIHGLSIFSIISLTFAVSHFGLKALLSRNPKAGQVGVPGNGHQFDVPFYIESDDHYVKIVSARGVELVRANLSDVAQKFGGKGMRCHKSYWVSIAAIKQRNRRGRQLLLLLQDGTEIPVGRSFEKQVRSILGRGQVFADAAA